MTSRRSLTAGALGLLAALAAAVPAAAEPIPQTGTTTVRDSGGLVAARPITPTIAPQNRFMARNPLSNIHNDSWMTDAYQYAGPLGRNTTASSGRMPPAVCGTLTFDRRGRIVSVCPSLAAPPQARIIDPDTLEIIARYDMPQAPNPPGTVNFQNFTGGGYFFLDERDRIWAATKTNHLFVLAQSADGRSLRRVRDYDLTNVLDENERIASALPDFSGRIWIASKQNGKVAVMDRKTGRARVLRLGEQIQNSFAVDEDAIYLVTDTRMYRLEAGADNRPRVAWSHRYDNSGIVKPGQADAGSGTTPTVMRGGYVAITDNADPMQVVVYRKDRRLEPGQRRVVCEVPVFSKGASATENSLITAGRSLIVENNYGYQDPFGPNANALTTPGVARVDVNRDGSGCRKVWTNTTERAPSVVPKLSTATGLIYLYTRDPDPNGSIPWTWTAVSWRTGRTMFKRVAGVGAAFNNNYAGMAISPEGAAYLGVISGIVKLSDAG